VEGRHSSLQQANRLLPWRNRLAIPTGSTKQDAAWEFIQYAMTLENQIGVYTYAGAAPALTAALSSLK